MLEPLENVRLSGLLPTVTVAKPEQIIPTCAALIAGGLNVVEITLRSDAALDAIELARRQFPDLTVGAGTILSAGQAEQARERGAQFFVTPGCNPAVLRYFSQTSLPFVPGCATGGEIEQCRDHGFYVVKIFPVEQLGGLAFLKALAGPYSDVRFVPLGGVSLATLGQYLAYPKVFACGGSWVAKSELIQQGDFAAIERNTREALSAVFRLALAPMRDGEKVLTLRSQDLERLDYYLTRRGVAPDQPVRFVGA
ncbi:MAG: bifunctional 4-hydroxy-2-oxoglutarate aldolase/2-dehydro-3-deoxy-phosphogluconate aldolase [Actinomycetia bacterium]|nr:bifunctional 4-hydroxy-2-oxoglutarate aldolase/2-dehydro-3-deoxy-phosphogluconate aldolase [Actinomycetes bacterium]